VPVPILILTGLLAALAPAPADSTSAPRRQMGRAFISPMGEPFFVRGPGDKPLADWFAQADSNRDGSLTAAEMQADADRFFGLLDADRDGEIGPDELTHYEQVIAPMDRARLGLLGLSEPVATADTDLSRGITRDEFHRAAQLRFHALDVDHRGLLTLAVLETLRPPPPARPKRDPDAAPDLDPNADTGG
jgi:hypothetical protein